MKFIYWGNVIMQPITALIFASYLYTGHEATFAVWFFAFCGVANAFVGGIHGITND